MEVGKDKTLFRDLCEGASDLIQSVSLDGKILYVNQAWLATLGYRQDEVGGLDVFDVIHPDHREHCRALMEEVIQGKVQVLIEADFVTKDGRRVNVEGSASCRYRDGRPVATCGIFRDVTQRRRTEERLDRLFTLSPDLLCVAGTDGYFKQVNPAFQQVLGYTREEMLARPIVDFVHQEDREATAKEIERLSKGLPTVDFQNRYRASDGSWRWLAWRAAPTAEEGMIYAVARDITRRKNVEAMLSRQTRELARSNADLEEFAYIASHDLRAPLRAIETLSKWIEDEVPQPVPEKAREHLHELRRRVRRMTTLTDDLLAYSRAGRETGELRAVDSAAMVRDVVFLLDPPAGFEIRMDDRMPVLQTFSAPLELTLRNLIGNAIKHHDREEGQVFVSAEDEGDVFRFEVRDDGPGIPESQYERIFKMFEKLESRDRVEGSGIGLALVKKIVESLGGRIGVRPVAERGTVFSFTWPKHVEEGQDADDPGRR